MVAVTDNFDCDNLPWLDWWLRLTTSNDGRGGGDRLNFAWWPRLSFVTGLKLTTSDWLVVVTNSFCIVELTSAHDSCDGWTDSGREDNWKKNRKKRWDLFEFNTVIKLGIFENANSRFGLLKFIINRYQIFNCCARRSSKFSFFVMKSFCVGVKLSCESAQSSDVNRKRLTRCNSTVSQCACGGRETHATYRVVVFHKFG